MNAVRDMADMGHFDPDDFEINHIELEIPRLSKSFDAYRLVQISDIHLGQWLTSERLDGVVGLVNDQDPDLVANTGDYFSWAVGEFAPTLIATLRRIKSRDGMFTVLGNHDHWTSADQIRDIVKEAGIIELANTVRQIRRDDGGLQVAGVDDVMVDHADLDVVVKQLNRIDPAILLAHEPDFADEAAATGRFILQLSGHSHGGQLVVPGLGTPVRAEGFKKYPLGLYNIDGMIQYTNRGLGTNWFWARLNCPPEITVFHLKPAPPEVKTPRASGMDTRAG